RDWSSDVCSSDLGDVAVTVAERGQPAGEHEQAVIEVAAEPAFGDGALEVDAGRGDDADIDADGALAAEAADLAVLEGGEQLGLERERQFRDLVEEQRASGGLLEETAVRLLCAGEGAAGVAEELALEEGLRDAGAVDGDEGGAGAARRFVDRAREEPLAGPRLAGEEDGCVDSGGTPAELPECGGSVARSEDAIEGVHVTAPG